MNLLKSAFLVSVVAFSFFFANCLKSNCTDQVKNSELYGVWYYYNVGEVYRYCDSTDSKGNSFYYHCDKLKLEKLQYQFSPDRFIVGVNSDTIVDTAINVLIDPAIPRINEYSYACCWGYNFPSFGEKDWFIDNSTLVICPINSLCFENECDVYTWKIEDGKLFLRNDRREYIFTREDLFKKIRNSVKPDTSE